MTHIFSHGLDQVRHLTHLAQKYDLKRLLNTPTPTTGFLAVRLAPGDPSPPNQLYKFPVGNSPSSPRRFKLRT